MQLDVREGYRVFIVLIAVPLSIKWGPPCIIQQAMLSTVEHRKSQLEGRHSDIAACRHQRKEGTSQHEKCTHISSGLVTESYYLPLCTFQASQVCFFAKGE